MWTPGSNGRRLEALEKSQERLERLPKLLQAEWEDQLDRMNRVMGRLNARIKVANQAQTDEPPPSNAEAAPEAPTPLLGTHERLQAMRRRRHGLLPG